MVHVPKGFTTDPYFNAIGSKAPNFRAWGVVYLKRKERRGLRKRVLYKQYARRGRFTLSDYNRKKNVVLIFFPYNLDFDGNMTIDGTLSETSDRRIKKDIVAINDSSALQKVRDLESYYYPHYPPLISFYDNFNK